MTVRMKETLTLANSIKEINMNQFVTDWETELTHCPKLLEAAHLAVLGNRGDLAAHCRRDAGHQLGNRRTIHVHLRILAHSGAPAERQPITRRRGRA